MNPRSRTRRAFALPAALAAAALALPPAALSAPAPSEPAPVTNVGPDVAATAGGYEVACTGIGQMRNDPRWLAYPVRVEISGAQNEYLVGAVVSIFDHAGRPLFTVACDGPWVLMKLPEGDYRVLARLAGSPAKPRSAPFKAPRQGQIRVVMQFPDV